MPITLTAERIDELADELAMAADIIEHPWDRLALTWPLLGHRSNVVEVGGFKGRWALQMGRRYNPQLHVFEPQAWAAAVCARVLESYHSYVHVFGLGVGHQQLPCKNEGTDGCSIVPASPGEDTGEALQLLDAVQVLNDLGLAGNNTDVMLINIEGYEYDLVPYLLGNEIRPRNLMIQMHLFAEKYPGHTYDLVKNIQVWYTPMWRYGVTLGAWTLKT